MKCDMCGKRIPDSETRCPYCGMDIIRENFQTTETKSESPQPQQQYNYSYGQTVYPVADRPSFVLNLIALLLPLPSIIMALFMIKITPRKARSMIFFAIISLIARIIITVSGVFDTVIYEDDFNWYDDGGDSGAGGSGEKMKFILDTINLFIR